MPTVPDFLSAAPDLFTRIIAWCSPAIAYLAAWLARRRLINERSFVVVASLRTSFRGAIDMRVANIGTRAANSIVMSYETGSVLARIDGIAAGGSSVVEIVPTDKRPRRLRISWLDIDGKEDGRTIPIEFTGGVWCLAGEEDPSGPGPEVHSPGTSSATVAPTTAMPN
ncbi:hypothetical protein [Sphingomonas sp. NFX23]|uniref:hypothetical protein n=1 Tax=Sphingomonas sp. NFX23 TaxID=2819532 RepID=UPI003CEAE5D6